MQCRVLGPLEITLDGVPLRLGGHKQRAVVGVLIAAAGRVVSVDRLTDDLWGDDPPAKASVSLQSYVANLRRILEPERAARSPARVLVSHPPGYALAIPTGGVDASTFQRLAASARDLVTTDPMLARERLDAALGLWRGDAYADVVGAAPGLVAEAQRLDELHRAAMEDRWAAIVALGGHTEVIGEIESFLSAHPLRERAWALLALALYRAHRQGDSLDALRRARAVLAEELGVDPGPELRRIESAVLAQDESLSTMAEPLEIGGRHPADDQPLVGRDRIMARLLAHATRATSGRGRLALITGEPGIGKTAIARAVTAKARALGLRTGWGACQATGGAPSLWPWTQAFQELLAGVDPESLRAIGSRYPALSGVVPAAVPTGSNPPVSDPDSLVFHQAEGIALLLTEAVGPSLIVLDDLQWADPDTLAVLRRLTAKVDRVPVVLLVTCRDAETDVGPALADAMGDLARRDPDRIGLTGLGLADVTAYLSRLHPVVPHAVAVSVLARTDGNPFYLEEVVRLLVNNGTLTDPHAVATLNVPDGVRDVVRQRLAGLPATVTGLLAVAALNGPRFDPEIVKAAVDLDADTADDAIDLAVSAHLIVADRGRYRFSHTLVQDAVVDRIGSARRRRLHARLARAIEALWATAPEERFAELAFHYQQAGPAHARATWTYAIRAADRAARRPAPAEAARLTELASAAITDDRTATAQERQHVALALILARQRVGQERSAWRTMIDTATAALDTADPATAAQAAVSIAGDSVWRWREYQTVDRTAMSVFRRLLTELPPADSVRRARVLAMLAAEMSYDPGSADDAIDLCERAVAQVRAASGAPPDLARVLESRHLVLDRPSCLPQRLDTAHELVALAESDDDPAPLGRALLFRGRDHFEAGDVAAGLADYAAARGIAEPHQIVPLLVALGFADAVLAIASGRYVAARDSLRRAHALHAGTSLPGAQELPIAAGATLHLARGTLHEAVPMLARAAAHSLFRDFYALALIKAGRRDDAVTVTGPWDQQAEPPQDYLWLTRMAIRAALWAEIAPRPQVVRLRAQLAPYDDRVTIAGTGIAIAGHLGTWTGLLDRTSGDLDRAVGTLTAAMHRSIDAGFRPFAAITAKELATTLRLRNRPGDRQQATRYAARAAELSSSDPATG